MITVLVFLAPLFKVFFFLKLQDNANLSNIVELQQSKFWEINLQGGF